MAAVLSSHLQEKLGPQASQDLAAAMEAAVSGVKDQVMELVAERLERRLGEARADLERMILETKAELQQQIAAVRSELLQQIAAVRSELLQQIAAVRTELLQHIAAVRSELQQQIADLRAELTRQIGGTVRWAFVFWATQMTALVGIFIGIVSLLLRR